MNHNILLVGSLVGASLFCAASAEENLLENGDFSNARGKSVVKWVLPQSTLRGHGDDASYFEYGVAEDSDGGKSLRLAVTEPVTSHFWWQQEVAALPGTEYQLTVRYRGEVEELGAGFAGEDVGLYFLDRDKHWIGYVRASDKEILDGEWHEIELSATSPDEAAFIGVRLGVMGNQAMEFHFDNVVLEFAD
ncbi:MAG: hypothetical protein ACQKBT_05440 [Puniceicoccales bacterium]